jgi:hypothetical protein
MVSKIKGNQRNLSCCIMLIMICMRYNLLFQVPVNHSLAPVFVLRKCQFGQKCYLHKITIKKLLSPLSIIESQALVSFKKYMSPPLPYFKVNIFPLPHFASIFFAYLWSFHWSNNIITLQRYFSLRLPHLNIPTGPPSDELDKNISERSLFYF